MIIRSVACVMSLVGVLVAPGRASAQAARQTPQADALPASIPIFPLGDVMLFPNVSRPLHIFEPRYRAMIADALKGDRIIGMVLLRPGYEADYEGRPPVYPIGCAGTIEDVEQLPDGRYFIMLRGLVRFRVTGEDNSRAYRLAQVEKMPEPPLTEEERAALRQSRGKLETLLAAGAPAGAQPIPSGLSDDVLVNALAQHLDIEPLARQDLLERRGPLARAEALIDLLALASTPRR
jgi:Lon protease-like protein